MGSSESTKDPRLVDLADRLTGIAEELADLGIEQLRHAVASHDADKAAPKDPTSPLAIERRITRARRAVEKAAVLLRGPTATFDD